MIITVECIHRAKDLPGEITEYAVCGIDNMVSESNKITCHINSVPTDSQFHLPMGSIILNDVMNFSNNMSVHQQYDCVLEITSFKQIDLYTNHNYSIRGLYRSEIPQRWLPKYYLYKDQECIEVGSDMILISKYNNELTNKVNDGEIIEIIANCELNLTCAKI